MFKLEQNTLFQKQLSIPAMIKKGDEVYFGRDILELRRFGARIIETKAIRAKVLSVGYVQHRNQPIFLLQNLEDENTHPFFLYEKNLLKYGAFLKGESDKEESIPGQETGKEDASTEVIASETALTNEEVIEGVSDKPDSVTKNEVAA